MKEATRGNDGRSFWRHPMAYWAYAVIALFLLWFGGWFWLAARTDAAILQLIDRQAQRGIDIECKDREVTGFPFRLGARCDTIAVSSADGSLAASAGRLRTTAQAYAPDEVIGELEGPLTFNLADMRGRANWENLRMFGDFELGGAFERVSLSFRGLTAALGDLAMDSARGGLHGRQAPVSEGGVSGDLDIAFDFNDSRISLGNGIAGEDFALVLEGRLAGGYRELIERGQGLDAYLRSGAKADIRQLTLGVPDGGKLILSGPVSVDQDGLLQGTVQIGVENGEALVAWAARTSPALEQGARLLTQALAGMGDASGGDASGGGMPTIDLVIDRGQLRLGFFTIAAIPPLF